MKHVLALLLLVAACGGPSSLDATADALQDGVAGSYDLRPGPDLQTGQCSVVADTDPSATGGLSYRLACGKGFTTGYWRVFTISQAQGRTTIATRFPVGEMPPAPVADDGTFQAAGTSGALAWRYSGKLAGTRLTVEVSEQTYATDASHPGPLDLRGWVDGTFTGSFGGWGVRVDGQVDAAVLAEIDRVGRWKLGMPHDNGGATAVHRYAAGWSQDFGVQFEEAIIMHGDGASEAFYLSGATMGYYFKAGGAWSVGYPVDRLQSNQYGSVQHFQSGSVVCGPDTYATTGVAQSCRVTGPGAPPPGPPPPPPPAQPGMDQSGRYYPAIYDCYARNGGRTALGPTLDAGGGTGVHVWNGAYLQDFSGGSTFSRSICVQLPGASKAYILGGAWFYVYFDFGGYAEFGMPLDDSGACVRADATRDPAQRFQYHVLWADTSSWNVGPTSMVLGCTR